MKKENKQILIFGIGIILICFTTVFLFTREAIIPYFDLSKTGSIGDTIGGITAPILNLAGMILIYLTFKEQIEANKIQKEAIENETKRSNAIRSFEICKDIFFQIKKDYSELEFPQFYQENYEPLLGKKALTTFVKDFETHLRIGEEFNRNIINDFTFIIDQYLLLINRFETDFFLQSEALYLKKLAIDFYNNKLKIQSNDLIYICSTYQTQMDLHDKLIELKSEIEMNERKR